MRYIGLALTVWTFFAWGNCGGDGPQPIKALTDLKAVSSYIPTMGAVKDFVFWQNRNLLVYRNRDDELWRVQPQSGWNGFLSPMGLPLSRITESTERFLITDVGNWVFLDGHWIRFKSPSKQARPVFWGYKRKIPHLYLLEDVRKEDKSQEIKIYEYRLGESAATETCSLVPATGEVFRLGEGAQYPHIPLFETKKVDKGTSLTTMSFDVKSCNLKHVGTYSHLFDGEIESVHWFENLNSYAIKSDSQTQNLMWDYGNGCRMHDIGKGNFLVPDHSVPIVGTWDSTEGLALVNLEKVLRGVFMPPSSFKGLRNRDVWFSKQAHSIYVAPRIESGQSIMVKVGVKEIE